MMNEPLALFRDAGGSPHAVLDRCPHRNAALSDGRVGDDGCIECPYHGWRFDGSGNCRAVPGLFEGDGATAAARNVISHAATERDGFVWVWAEAGGTPTREPFAMPDLLRGDGREGRKRWQVGEVIFPCDLDATMHAALENTLDVPHTAFLHRGIFRGKRLKELTAVRQDFDGGVEVEFLGEPVGLGPIQGGPFAKKTFQHWDRFVMPCVAQVEYRVENWVEIYNNVIHLPLSPAVTARGSCSAGGVRCRRACSPPSSPPRAGWSCVRTNRPWRLSRATSTASVASVLPPPISTCSARRSGVCCVRRSAPRIAPPPPSTTR